MRRIADTDAHARTQSDPLPTVTPAQKLITVNPEENPAGFLRALPASERECLEQTVGPEKLEEFIASEEPAKETVRACLSEETIRNMTLGGMATQAGGFSDQTVTCLLDKTESLDYLGMLLQEGIGPEFSTFMQASALCLSDEELLRSQGSGSLTAEQLRCAWLGDPEVVATFGNQSPEVAELFSKCSTSPGLLEGSAGPRELEACFIEAIGERAGREVFTGQRPPTSDELDAMAGCRIAVAVGERNGPTPEPVAVGEGNGLTPEQEACLVEAIGEDWKLISEQRPPTPDELDALVGCGIMEPQPDFDLLPEASAPAGLGTVAWPNNFQESSALFERLPSEIAGHGIRARFEQSGPGIFSTTYGGDKETTGNVMVVTVHDLTKGAFFPTDANAGQFVALYAHGSDWEVLAAGREGDLAWVQWKTGGLYTMHWGNAPSSIVFQAMANDLGELMALAEAMVSAASE